MCVSCSGIILNIGGNLFILFASHIGISNSSNLGHYTRLGESYKATEYTYKRLLLYLPRQFDNLLVNSTYSIGQTRDGTACGAACGALAHCKAYQAQLDAAAEAGCQPCDTSAAGRVEMRKPGEKPSDYQMDYIKSEVSRHILLLLLLLLFLLIL